MTRDLKLRLALVPLLASPIIATGLFITVAYRANHLSLADTTVLASVMDKLIIDVLLFLAAITICVRWRQRMFACIFSLAYLGAFFLETAVYYYSQSRFEQHLVFMTRPESVSAFLAPRVLFFAALWLIISILVSLSILCSGDRLRRMPGGLFFLFAVALWALNVPRRVVDLKVSLNGLERTVAETSTRHLWQELSFLRANSFVRVARELVVTKDVQANVPSLDYFQQMAPSLRRVGLSFGERTYAPVLERPFRKVILVTVESLSLDFLAPYNRELPPGLTPFLGGQEGQMFVNVKTSRVPTRQGLAAHFNSHPNSELIQDGDRPSRSLSLLWHLRAAGYRTVHIRGSSRHFAFESVIYRDWGFSDFLSRETFADNYDGRSIDQWGLLDRLVFEETVSFLKHSASEKDFVHILTVDTHLPHGRDDYAGLTYPDRPAVSAPSANVSKLLDSVSKFDYDLSFFVRRLQEEGLWTDDLLLIVTADHCCPRSVELAEVPGYPADPLCRVPVVFLSKRELPPAETQRLGSQLDLAPTLLHLLGERIPAGWWGDSLYAARGGFAVGMFSGALRLTSEKGERSFDINNPEQPDERLIAFAYNSIIP